MANVMRSIVCVSLLTAAGCGIIVQPALVPNRNVEHWTVADPNAYGISVTKTEDTFFYAFSQTADFNADRAILPYRRTDILSLSPAAVNGSLNGRTYFTLFDTGASPGIFIEDAQINRHNLPVLFWSPQNKKESGGLAIVNKLNLGPVQLTDFPCSFMKHHAEHRLLGLVPIHRFEWIIVPLDIMCQFGHIEFNQVEKHLRISETDPFVPDDNSQWIMLPFGIAKAGGVRHLLLKTRLEGVDVMLYLDTGANYDFELNSSLVEQLYETRPDFRRAWKRSATHYGPYAGGIKKGKKFTAKQLRLADHVLRSAKISFVKSPDDDPTLYDGTIGLGLFSKTVMVLDFKQNLMWIKKQKGSRFEDQSAGS